MNRVRCSVSVLTCANVHAQRDGSCFYAQMLFPQSALLKRLLEGPRMPVLVPPMYSGPIYPCTRTSTLSILHWPKCQPEYRRNACNKAKGRIMSTHRKA